MNVGNGKRFLNLPCPVLKRCISKPWSFMIPEIKVARQSTLVVKSAGFVCSLRKFCCASQWFIFIQPAINLQSLLTTYPYLALSIFAQSVCSVWGHYHLLLGPLLIAPHLGLIAFLPVILTVTANLLCKLLCYYVL